MSSFDLSPFLAKHQLPQHYADIAQAWFLPLAEQLAKKQQQHAKTLIIGINGAQGSGKSTLTDLLVSTFKQSLGLSAVALSLDDFYLSKQQRQHLADTVHPLLATRGVPGTHDVELAINILQQLNSSTRTVIIPRFDKAIDDRLPQAEWQVCSAPVDIIVVEGWCLGVQAQTDISLTTACNDLEQQQDKDGRWRQYVNQQLVNHYPALFSQLDELIMLQAPSFDCVYQWRLQQEQKLAKQLTQQQSTTGVMTEQALQRFIMHFQRLTEHGLATLPMQADVTFELDENRQITNRY
ncbi:hypothetical protein A9Q78_00380 [Methylophaga sp. 41_12_T18]|nr:hypothetical protein A9Q78_00380 [Methylophaga sp. 41_12_T18]